MIKVLIIFNIFLAGALTWSVATNLRPVKNELPEVSNKNSRKKIPAAKTPPAVKTATVIPTSEAQKIIKESDVFSSLRTPFANSRGGRLSMTLLGTFKIGTTSGAIIRQQGGNRMANPYLQQLFGFPGGMGRSGRFQPGQRNGFNNNSNQTNVGIKQYLRVGESLSNGYILSEVTRSKAVLTRGNDKIELELQDPSRNRTTAVARPRNLTPAQQLQQAQMIQQQMMMRMMQRMQNNNNNQPVPGGGNRGRGR